MKRTHSRIAVALTGAVLIGAAATACSSDASRDESTNDAATAGDWPRTVDNCGRKVTIPAEPRRVVSGWPSNTETLLELGAADRIAGQYNTSNGDPTEANAAAWGKVTVLGEGGIGREQLLAAKPDLLWVDGTYLFDGKQLPTIEDLDKSGVPVLVLSGFCTADASQGKVADLFTDLDLIGTALGMEAEAKELAESAHARLDAVDAEAGKGQKVAMFGVFDGVIYGQAGVYSDMARQVGATNTFEGTFPKGSYFGEVSKEALIQQDPDALVYLYNSNADRDGAKAYLEKTFPNLKAVRTGHIVLLPAVDSANLRLVDGVEVLAEGLARR